MRVKPRFLFIKISSLVLIIFFIVSIFINQSYFNFPVISKFSNNNKNTLRISTTIKRKGSSVFIPVFDYRGTRLSCGGNNKCTWPALSSVTVALLSSLSILIWQPWYIIVWLVVCFLVLFLPIFVKCICFSTEFALLFNVLFSFHTFKIFENFLRVFTCQLKFNVNTISDNVKNTPCFEWRKRFYFKGCVVHNKRGSHWATIRYMVFVSQNIFHNW